VLKKGTIQDLLMMAGEDQGRGYRSALKYLLFLERAGYLRKLPVRARGTAPTSNGFVRWLLVDDTGPEAPVVQPLKGEVVDRNTLATRLIRPGRGRRAAP
jgi:hypothetical protein